MRRQAGLYPALVAVFLLALVLSLQFGGIRALWSTWSANLSQPLARLMLQIFLVIVVARVLGAIARRLGQPSVIGEMAAGIVLGPSLFGALAPEWYARVFPKDSFVFLNALSQVGVIVFLFGVGLDFNWRHVRHRARAAVVVSNVSILVPFLLGVLTALALYPDRVPAGIGFQPFALFMGIAMSITAFPVLARILTERGLLATPVGSLALTCAAIDDVSAWTLLAFVTAVVTAAGSMAVVMQTVLLTALFVLLMAVVAPSLLRAAFSGRADRESFSRERVSLAIAVLFASALATEVIGVHALFGAFVAGATLPAPDDFRSGLRERLESFSSVLLLPLFFAYTGLRTEMGLIADWRSAGLCAGIILIATAGKLGAGAFAGRLTGLDWPTAFVLGALLNTRGLMELVALNVGYDLGVISGEMFTILVVMALVTTAMTGPLVSAAMRRLDRRE